MDNIKLVRFHHPDYNTRIGVRIDNLVHDVSDQFPTITEWLKSSQGRVKQAIDELAQLANNAQQVYEATSFDHTPNSNEFHWLAPVDEQDVWASGVTYERSREARQEEVCRWWRCLCPSLRC